MTTTVQIGLVTGIFIVLATPVATRILQWRFDPFEPILIFAVAYTVMFVCVTPR
jgi:hypothetical protein